MQMIFQDPISSLNPRRKVEDIIAEGLRIWKIGDDGRAASRRSTRCSTPSASIPSCSAAERPHQFSGGQCQRISIARAVVTDPKLIICDEPVSALDVSVQAQILNLLEDMKARYGLTLIFIAHDLAVVKNVSDRVAVMYLGKICEVGAPDALYAAARAPVHRGAARRDPGPRPRRRARGARQASAARSRRRSRRRAAAGSAPAARRPQDLLCGGGAADPRGRAGHFVACHFPLAPGETLPTPAAIAPDGDTPRPESSGGATAGPWLGFRRLRRLFAATRPRGDITSQRKTAGARRSTGVSGSGSRDLRKGQRRWFS